MGSDPPDGFQTHLYGRWESGHCVLGSMLDVRSLTVGILEQDVSELSNPYLLLNDLSLNW